MNKKKKDKETCRQLSEQAKDGLARLIILSVSSSHIRRGTSERKRRILRHGKHNAFLTGRITPLAPDYWHQDMDNDSPINLTTPENFDYLYRSASRYAELMGIKLPFRYRKGGCPRLNITELYRVMEECVTGVYQSGKEKRKAAFLSVPPSRLAGNCFVLDSG